MSGIPGYTNDGLSYRAAQIRFHLSGTVTTSPAERDAVSLEELLAAREKLKALEPRQLTCDDEWIAETTHGHALMRFHDYPNLNAARDGMKRATYRVVRVPVAAAEPEKERLSFEEAEAKAYFRKHGGLTEAARGLPGTPKTASASMAPEPFLKNEEPGEKTRPYDVFRAEADRILAARAPEPAKPSKAEPAPLKVGDRVRVLHENFVGESGKIMDVRTDARFLYGVRLVENAALYWFHACELERIPAAEEPKPVAEGPFTHRHIPLPLPHPNVQHLERKIERQRAQLRLMQAKLDAKKMEHRADALPYASAAFGWKVKDDGSLGPMSVHTATTPDHQCAALLDIVKSSHDREAVRKAALALLGEKP